MGLTLKDIYNMRSGIIDFSKNLFKENPDMEFFNKGEDINNLLKSTFVKSTKLEKLENEDEKHFKKREKKHTQEEEKRKSAFCKDLVGVVEKAQKEYAKHKIALDTYSYLVEKHNELVNENKGHENDLIIEESRKNIYIFKSQMEKNGVYNFEILGQKVKDQKLDEKLQNGIFAIMQDDIKEVMNKHNANVTSQNKEAFENSFISFMNMENLEKFDVKSINESNNKFYGFMKNAGYDFARKFKTDYYVMPMELQECPSGYKYNESGEMVAKESTGFFSAIANFFGRLFNSGKAEQYNTSLRQTKEALHDEEYIKDANEARTFDSEKKQINLDKEFEAEGIYAQDYEKDLLTERKLMHEQEINKVNDDIVGPGLEQID